MGVNASISTFLDGHPYIFPTIVSLVAVIVGRFTIGDDQQALAAGRDLIEICHGMPECRSDTGITLGLNGTDPPQGSRPGFGPSLDIPDPTTIACIAGKSKDPKRIAQAIGDLTQDQDRFSGDIENAATGDPGAAGKADIEQEGHRGVPLTFALGNIQFLSGIEARTAIPISIDHGIEIQFTSLILTGTTVIFAAMSQ